MGEFYSGVNIVGMVKETIEIFFRLGPLHVNVVYETKPGQIFDDAGYQQY